MAIESISQSRRLFFRSKGGSYSAIFMAETGDLWQEYDGTPDNVTRYYPDFTQNPVTLNLILTSSRSTGTVTFDTPVYRVAGTQLGFSGTKCNTPGFTDIFELTADGMLRVIGNLVKIANGTGFLIEAVVTIGDDMLTAHLPVSIAKHTDANMLRVTIAPGDTQNFTITTKGGNCILKAMVYKNGALLQNGVSYKWFKMGVSGWEDLKLTTQSITVQEADVETYASYKVEVWEGSAVGDCQGSDTQGVMDASDPYDITVQILISENGTAEVATTREELTDVMPDNAYLKYVPTMVKRTDQSIVSGVTWNEGQLVTATGLAVIKIPYDNGYKITVEKLKSTGYGEFEFIFSGSKN